MRRKGWTFAAMCLMAALLVGCGSGEKTDMEKGLEALDTQQWTQAIAIFKAMPKSAERDKYLSSAYAGAAGLDLIELAVQVTDAQNTGNSSTVAFEVSSKLLHPVDGLVLKEDLDLKIGYLSNAVSVYIANFETLTPPIVLNSYNLNNDQKIQVGLETAILAQYKIMSGLPLPGSDPAQVFVDPSALSTYLTDNALSLGDILDPAVADDFLTNAIGLVSTGMDAINAISNSNDLSAEMNTFLEQIGYSEGANISSSDLEAYLQSILDANP